MRKIKLLSILGMAIVFSLCGCQESTGEEKKNDPYAYLKELESGNYYVRHSNNKCEKVYFGNATFDKGNTVSRENDRRIMWFKEDFENIPTLYEGESLIYYTKKELEEEFNFERFEDMGYSIGLCGLTETVSGRYSISTNPNNNNTYPGGDTDAILLLENGRVIIDTLGGKELRTPVQTDRGVTGDNPVSRCNTIVGLKKGVSYKAEIYEGTERHEYIFTADVKILASMEVKDTTDYKFESQTIINIQIPEEFNTGYYMINGLGLFRYVKGSAYDEMTNFNIPNQKKDTNGTITGVTIIPQPPAIPAYREESGETGKTNKDIEKDLIESTFKVAKTGIITIKVTISETDNPSVITGIINTPDGGRYQMTRGDSALELTINAKEKGDYTLELYNLGSATASLVVTYKEEK